jgi:hypothetical protein
MIVPVSRPSNDMTIPLAAKPRAGGLSLMPGCRGQLLQIAADVRRLASAHPQDGKLLKSLAALMEAVAR